MPRASSQSPSLSRDQVDRTVAIGRIAVIVSPPRHGRQAAAREFGIVASGSRAPVATSNSVSGVDPDATSGSGRRVQRLGVGSTFTVTLNRADAGSLRRRG
jgi:hypothetical protein